MSYRHIIIAVILLAFTGCGDATAPNHPDAPVPDAVEDGVVSPPRPITEVPTFTITLGSSLYTCEPEDLEFIRRATTYLDEECADGTFNTITAEASFSIDESGFSTEDVALMTSPGCWPIYATIIVEGSPPLAPDDEDTLAFGELADLPQDRTSYHVDILLKSTQESFCGYGWHEILDQCIPSSFGVFTRQTEDGLIELKVVAGDTDMDHIIPFVEPACPAARPQDTVSSPASTWSTWSCLPGQDCLVAISMLCLERKLITELVTTDISL